MTNHILKTVLTVGALIIAPFASFAEPSYGQLIGQEGDFLKFTCTKTTDWTAKCEFTQVMLSQQAKPEELEEQLSQIDETMSEFEAEDMTQVCEEMSKFPFEEMLNAARSGDRKKVEDIGSAIPDFDADELMSKASAGDERELQDIMSGLNALMAMCDGVTREKVERLIRLKHEKQSRTCKMWINHWEDTFERVSDKIWSIQANGPRGECGAVRLDRFECDKDYPSLCNFFSEKRILNPEGNPLPGLGPMCGELDEGVFVYSWKTSTQYLKCEIIDF